MITYILIALVAVVLAYLIHSLGKTNASIANIAQAHNLHVAATKKWAQNIGKSLGEIRAQDMEEDPQITEITARLEEITKDIARLDGEIAQVARDEKEIRSYYVNFREPIVKDAPYHPEDVVEVELPFPGDTGDTAVLNWLNSMEDITNG